MQMGTATKWISVGVVGASVTGKLSVCERSVCVWIGGLPMSCDHASV